MKNKYLFWSFLTILISFVIWWYYYAFTTLNVPEEDMDTIDNPLPAVEKRDNFEIRNPEPMEVGEALTGEITYTINASSSEEWVYFDFSKGSTVEVSDRSSPDWDIGFRRAVIISNSGKSNPNGVGGVAELAGVEFESVKEAPESGYKVDIRKSPLETENPAIAKWYNYNFMTHFLKPKNNVYIIRTADGRYAKMQILKYYCGRAPGCYTIKYVYQGNGGRKFY